MNLMSRNVRSHNINSSSFKMFIVLEVLSQKAILLYWELGDVTL